MLIRIWSKTVWNDNQLLRAAHKLDIESVKFHMGYHTMVAAFHKWLREKYGEPVDATMAELVEDLNECYDNLTQYNDGVMEYATGINTAYAELKLMIEI